MVGNANANGIPFLKRYGIPPAIKNSMVLWYDIARQGATNESMAENPILKDFSGNGHDITCYNFAWSGMSGIGGFITNFNTWNKQIEDCVANDHKLIIRDYFESTPDAAIIYDNSQSEYTMQFKVQGITDSGLRLEVGKGSIVESDSSIKQDGIYTRNKLSNNIAGFKLYGQKPANGINITIELLPEYPNALVSDGVDDYAYVEGLPILTDYTVITKRILLDNPNRVAIATKFRGDDTINGAFAFEFIDAVGNKKAINFGSYTDIVFELNDISWQTKKSYNGSPINKSNLNDTELLNLFTVRPNDAHTKAVLYSFFLFNRTLTANEIEWVKTNLISVSTNE